MARGKTVVLVFVAVVAILVFNELRYLWQHRIRPEQGMLYYPGGGFPFGPDDTPTNLGPFYIDEAEVSNAEYAAYCNASRLNDAACEQARKANSSFPVVNVTPQQAEAYARSLGKRLPTAEEWERAARRVDALKYPWGNVMDATYANVSDNPTLKKHELMPVRSFRKYPHYQMTGNAAEIVEQNGAFQLRGGSYKTPLADASSERFQSIPADFLAPDAGFRCAKSYQP